MGGEIIRKGESGRIVFSYFVARQLVLLASLFGNVAAFIVASVGRMWRMGIGDCGLGVLSMCQFRCFDLLLFIWPMRTRGTKAKSVWLHFS